MTKPRLISDSANTNSIDGSRLVDGSVSLSKLGGGGALYPSNDISYTNDGLDAVERTVQARLRDSVNVTDFIPPDHSIANSDCSDFINNAIAYCLSTGKALHFPSGTYLVAETIDFRGVCLFAEDAVINSGTSDISPVVLLGGGNSGDPQFLGEVKRGASAPGTGTPTTPGWAWVRITGSSSQQVTLHRTRRLEFYVDSTDPKATACNYNTYYLGNVRDISVNTNPSGSASQPFNSNSIYINRGLTFQTYGTYAHNDNRVYGGTFEGTAAAPAIINITQGSFIFYDQRLESGGAGDNVQITFGPNSFNCSIENSYAPSIPAYPGPGISVTNQGLCCGIGVVQDKYYPVKPIVAFDYSSVERVRDLGGISNDFSLVPAEETIQLNGNTFFSKIFPVYSRNVFHLYSTGRVSGTPSVSVILTGYDASMNPITPTGDDFYSSFIGASLSFGSTYAVLDIDPANTVSMPFLFVKSNAVKFLKIELGGAATTKFKSLFLGGRFFSAIDQASASSAMGVA